MTVYTLIILVSYLCLRPLPRHLGGGDGIGTLFLAVLWPLIPVGALYFAFKKYVLKRPGVHPVYVELELSFCVLVACALIFYVCTTKGPVYEFLIRSALG